MSSNQGNNQDKTSRGERVQLKKKEKTERRAASSEKERNDAARKKDRKPAVRTAPAEQTKRVSSITRRLHWYGIRGRTLRFFRTDLLFLVLCCAGWCIEREYTRLGRLSPNMQRSLIILEKTGEMVYRVATPGGRVLLQAGVLRPFTVICMITGGVLALQLTGQLFTYFREDRRIRKILSPINEIALKADELSQMSFTEDKYEEIEKALENIQPGQSDQDTPLSFSDSDLSGVEAAMNNLLLRMRETYRQQARFVNDASHELRTPIAVILGYANMLDRWGKSDPQTLEEGISAIKTETEHMNHLVEQLLFLARGDSGKTALDYTEMDLNALIREVYEECFMIDEAHVYRLRVQDGEIRFRGDQALLKQAVRILTDNAAKYTPQGEEILLSAGFNEKKEPYLQVQDLGLGMSETELPHIFERFYRSDEVRSSAGTGLGLSIAKWIVDKHKGHFEVLSREKLGTRIRIVLPEYNPADETKEK